MKVLQFPLTKITFCFIAGILFVSYFHVPLNLLWLFLIGCGAFFAISYFLSRKKFAVPQFFGVLTLIFSFLIGITAQVVHSDFLQKDNYINNIDNTNNTHLIELVLREKLKNSLFSERYVAIVKKIDNKPSSGKILLNIEKDSQISNLGIGSNLKIEAKITKHKPPKNPNQFDYGRYLTQKSILAQIYCNVSDMKISPKYDKDIWYYAAKIRSRIIDNLQKSNFNTTELNIALALILGQQQDISPDILQDYQYAGAVHILSVSGLHVGYLLVFINFILLGLPKNKSGNFIRFTIILLSLWGFAVLAGLSPSVVRSVTMFSFVAAGVCLNRGHNIFHTLIVSLLLILIVSPSFLFDVGFQLSYVSLFFIVWLQPELKKLWSPKNKIAIYFWDIITVSFAAQIGAFPLSIFYFHQFPGLFFITNLIVLPGIGIIMALGIFVMLFAFFTQVPAFIIQSLVFCIWLMNWIIAKIASLEQFIIQDIPMTKALLIALYLMIIAVIIWFKKPSFKKLAFSLIVIVGFQITFFATQFYFQKQDDFVIFNVQKKSLILEKSAYKSTVYSNDGILKNSYEFKNVNNYIVANFIKNNSFEKSKNVYFYKNKKILVIDSLGVFPAFVAPNIIILSQSPKINLDRLLSIYQPELIIADGSNFKTYCKLWATTCTKNKIPFHATAEKGFYRIED